MKYRTKLYFALIGISLLSILLGLVIVYSETKRLFFKEIRSKIESIAATAATFIDGDLLSDLHSPEDEKLPNYVTSQNILRKARNANRRHDVYVRYMYTLSQSPENPNLILFGVDAEEDPNLRSYPGQVYVEADRFKLPEHFLELYSPNMFIHDQWGEWLSGYAPIYNSQGKVVATLGVDVSASDVIFELDKLIQYGAIALAISFFIALFVAFILSRQVTLSLASLCDCVKEIGEGNLTVQAKLKTHDEFNDLAQAINNMTKGLQERERLKANFARYVSKHVLEKILKSDTPMKLEGERRKITVLFSDIRQFTHLAEKLAPEEVVSLLNEYFDKMLEVIFKNQGTLDKFLGDGLMVEFGAPLEDIYQEKHAVLTAIQMQEELRKLCDKWEKEGKPRIDIGIGIHTGIAIVGNIGSERRLEYTAIGDTVNVASRLQFATKVLKTSILVSETTFKTLLSEFNHKNLGSIPLPGRSEEVVVYAVYQAENSSQKSEDKKT